MSAVTAADETHILLHFRKVASNGFHAYSAFLCDFRARYFGIRFYAVEYIALHFGKFLRDTLRDILKDTLRDTCVSVDGDPHSAVGVFDLRTW